MTRRQTTIAVLLAAVTAVSFTAAGVSAQAATCSPSGSALSISAFDSKFDKSCLAAAADQAFTIDFSNLDRGIPHNVAIYEDETANKMFFKGDLVDGPGKTTYSAPALPVGSFFFRCDPHPDMKGTFVSAG